MWGQPSRLAKAALGDMHSRRGSAAGDKQYDITKSVDAAQLKNNRGCQIFFPQFLVWWADSEVRKG